MSGGKIICVLLISAIIGIFFVFVGAVYAHCDTMSGPVAVAAR